MKQFDSSLLSSGSRGDCHAAVNIDAINMLAKLLANENLDVVHNPAASTAMFQPKTRTLVLPAWSGIPKLIYVLFSAHEIGHALWTPQNGFSHPSIPDAYKGKDGFMSLLNVTEDARIEKRVKRKYPGLRNDFMDGYKKLFNAGFFGVDVEDIALLNLADRINIRMKLGSWVDAHVPFHDDIEQGFLDRAHGLESFVDAVDLAVDLYEHMSNDDANDDDDSGSDDGQNQEDDSSEMSLDNSDGETITQDDDVDSSASSTDSDGDGDSDEDSSGSGDTDSDDSIDSDDSGDSGSGESSDEEKDSSGSITEGSGAGAGSDDSSFDPGSKTDEAGRMNSDSLRDANALEPLRLNAPIGRIDPSTIVDDTHKILGEFRDMVEQRIGNSDIRYSFYNDLSIECKKYVTKCKPVVSYLAKEFEMKKAADEHRRSSVSRSGVLNVNKLHSHKYNEDVFLRKAIMPDAKNHGLVMFIDFSGSMSYNMEATLEQLINLVLFCKRVSIPFEVYGFNDYSTVSWGQRIQGSVDFPKYKKGDVVLHDFRLRQYVTDKLNARDFKSALEYLFYLKKYYGSDNPRYFGMQVNESTYSIHTVPDADNLGSTPLNNAIVVGIDVVNNFRKSRGVQVCNVVFLTDGASNGMQTYFDPSDPSARPDGTVSIRSQSYDKNVYLADEKTKENYSFSTSYRGYGYEEYDSTGFLLRMMKNACDVNIAGFFILPSHGAKAKQEIRTLLYGQENVSEVTDSIYDDVRKDGVGVVTKAGYDVLFAIKGGKNLKTSEESVLGGLPDDATVAQIRSAFKKGSKNKLKSRVLLTKFVDLIA
jgi:hypothetical protein